MLRRTVLHGTTLGIGLILTVGTGACTTTTNTADHTPTTSSTTSSSSTTTTTAPEAGPGRRLVVFGDSCQGAAHLSYDGTALTAGFATPDVDVRIRVRDNELLIVDQFDNTTTRTTETIDLDRLNHAFDTLINGIANDLQASEPTETGPDSNIEGGTYIVVDPYELNPQRRAELHQVLPVFCDAQQGPGFGGLTVDQDGTPKAASTGEVLIAPATDNEPINFPTEAGPLNLDDSDPDVVDAVLQWLSN